jgi:prepilin signal peptidase PulO-like enzyme (type II secretory pathway)
MEQFIKIIIFIFGASIGSFLNVLIDRLSHDESINGRSHCDHCKKKIAWYDLFPVISFIFLKGKTRCCKKKLSWQYPMVEFVTGFIFVMVFKDGPYLGQSFIRSVLISGTISCLIVIFVSDLKYHLISDYILLALFVFSLLFHLFNNEATCLPAGTVKQFGNLFLSGVIVSLPIFLIYYFSKERAMGLGDVYLSAIMGFLLGWQKGFLALYIAFITGAIIGVLLILLRRKKIKSKISFGPFLVIGTVTMLFWGEKVLEIIKKIYGF